MSKSNEQDLGRPREVAPTRELDFAREQRKVAMMKDLVKLEEEFLEVYLCSDLRRVCQMHEVDSALRRLLVRMRRISAFARKNANVTEEEWSDWLKSGRRNGRSLDDFAPSNEPDP